MDHQLDLVLLTDSKAEDSDKIASSIREIRVIRDNPRF